MKKADFDHDTEKHALLFFNNLSEKDKRLYAGLEALRIGYYGVTKISVKYKIHKHTIRCGQKELLSGDLVSTHNIRRKGGGRKKK